MTEKKYSEGMLTIVFWAGLVVGVGLSFFAIIGIGIVSAVAR